MHPGRVFSEFQVSEAVAETFGKAASVSVAVNGFRRCGLWPLNQDIFEEHEFAAALTTDQPLPAADTNLQQSVIKLPSYTSETSDVGISTSGPDTVSEILSPPILDDEPDIFAPPIPGDVPDISTRPIPDTVSDILASNIPVLVYNSSEPNPRVQISTTVGLHHTQEEVLNIEVTTKAIKSRVTVKDISPLPAKPGYSDHVVLNVHYRQKF